MARILFLAVCSIPVLVKTRFGASKVVLLVLNIAFAIVFGVLDVLGTGYCSLCRTPEQGERAPVHTILTVLLGCQSRNNSVQHHSNAHAESTARIKLKESGVVDRARRFKA
jgi:hypothetical protein